MKTMHAPARTSVLRTAALLLLFSLPAAGHAGAKAEDGYEKLFGTMKARQPQLDKLLTNSDHCLGEGLDGLLRINAVCSAEARALAEQENQDRRALNGLMSAELGVGVAEVGAARAGQNVDRYLPGILREVRISETETTWWDGHPPDPRKTSVARVLALRYAHMHEQPDGNSPVVRDNVQQYEAFGVVDSVKDGSGEQWHLLTEEHVPKIKPPGWSPKTVGWMAAKEAIPWRRAVVMRFTSPYQREPSLFFKSPDPIVDLIRKAPADRAQALQEIRARLGSGGADGIVTVEPSIGAGQEHMIMYPVLDFQEDAGGSDLRIDGKSALLLEVAARTRAAGADGGGQGTGSVPIDIVFVMDTTQSMGPYLQDVLAATEEFAKAGKSDALRFGFVGYRDEDPGFEYKTKEFTRQTLPAAEFASVLSAVKAWEQPVKGDDVPESVFAGVDAALESGQWRKDAVKILFLVGDAPDRAKQLNARVLRDKAAVRQIRIFAFHLKNSKVSKGWDKESQKQYGELTSFMEGVGGASQSQNYLHVVDAGAVKFREVVLERFLEAQKSLEAIGKAAQAGASLPEAERGSLSELIFQQASLLLADSSLPEGEARGWVCDKVLTNPDREALAPMILLSETELEELDARVRELKDIGEKALRGDGGTTLDFFDLVSQNTRFTMVNPTAVNFRDAFSAPLGIGDLPYDSDIMAATRDEFEHPDRVQDFVRSMDNKLKHYEDLKRKMGDPDVWKKLSVGAAEGDRVVGVELGQLP